MRNAFRISALFFTLSLLWITVSDKLVFEQVPGQILHLINSVKGYFFIIAITVLLYWLIYQNNAQLSKEHQRHLDIQELSNVGDWQYLIDKKSFKISSEVLNILHIASTAELTPVEILMKHIHPDDKARLKSALNEILVTGKDMNFVHRVVSEDGRIRFVRQTGKLLHSEGVVLGVCQDITETIELRDSLKETNEENKRLGEIISKVKNLVMLLDGKNRITWVNNAFTQRTGFSLAEVYGQDAGKFGALYGDRRRLKEQEEAIRSNRIYAIDVRSKTKAGDEFWSEITMTPIFDEYGGLIGAIIIGTEITDRKKAQEQLRHQYDILKDIAWKTSHEIRRPVASILALNTLIQSSETPEEKEEIFAMLNTCTLELDDIIREINQKINREAEQA